MCLQRKEAEVFIQGEEAVHCFPAHFGGRALCCPPDLQAALDTSWCSAHTHVSVVHVDECCLRDYRQQRELFHHKWVVVTVMGVIIKEVNEVPTANVKVSYLNNIIIVTTTESEDKQMLTLILTLFYQPEWKHSAVT